MPHKIPTCSSSSSPSSPRRPSHAIVMYMFNVSWTTRPVQAGGRKLRANSGTCRVNASQKVAKRIEHCAASPTRGQLRRTNECVSVLTVFLSTPVAERHATSESCFLKIAGLGGLGLTLNAAEAAGFRDRGPSTKQTAFRVRASTSWHILSRFIRGRARSRSRAHPRGEHAYAFDSWQRPSAHRGVGGWEGGKQNLGTPLHAGHSSSGNNVPFSHKSTSGTAQPTRSTRQHASVAGGSLGASADN